MLMRMTLTYFITAHAATVAVPLAALPDLRRLVVIRPEECLRGHPGENVTPKYGPRLRF